MPPVQPQVQKFVDDFNAQVARANQSINNVNADIARRNTEQESQKVEIAALKKALEDIQNSPGNLSPEDQASLDAALASATTIADSLDATDAMTPIDVIPPVNPIP